MERDINIVVPTSVYFISYSLPSINQNFSVCYKNVSDGYEPRCEKTGFLYVRKQRRRSALWYPPS